MEDFWDSICQALERRHSTLKFRWDLNIDNNGIDFRIEKSDGVYILVFFDNKYVSYDIDYARAIVNHVSHIILNKFQEDFTMENKKIFVSRPMNGVSLEDDNKLLKDIREALIKEHVLGNFVNAEVVNTWLGPVVPDDISDEQARVWRLGRAISDMAAADVLIFVPSGAKGCRVELEVYWQYKNVMADKWCDVFAYRNGELERLNDET